jgi:Flp pilus assembly protein TadD
VAAAAAATKKSDTCLNFCRQSFSQNSELNGQPYKRINPMKSLLFVPLGLSLLLLLSGCQHAVHPSLEMQQKFFSSLKDSNPIEEHALRAAQYHNLVGRADLALNELNRALEQSPNSVRLLNAVGGCYDRLGNYAKARQMYEMILAQDAGNNLVKNNLGYSCYLSGDFAGAERIFQEILASQPGDTLARNNLGLVWCRQGKEKEAMGLWQKAEGDIQAREKLNQVLAFLGKPVEPSSGNAAQGKGKPPETPEALANGFINQGENMARLSEMTRPPKGPADSCPAPLAAAVPQSFPFKNSQTAKNPAGVLPKPQVKIEEVEMVVQPASFNPSPASSNPAPQTAGLTQSTPDSLAPPAVPGRTRKPSAVDYFLEDLKSDRAEPSTQRYFRRSQWQGMRKSKIITYPPVESPKTEQTLKNCLHQESVYQPRNASNRQETTVY